jgi:hypothetical protein
MPVVGQEPRRVYVDQQIGSLRFLEELSKPPTGEKATRRKLEGKLAILLLQGATELNREDPRWKPKPYCDPAA